MRAPCLPFSSRVNALNFSPPWPNSSATRATAYDTFDAYDLWKLDLPALLGDTTTLVAVWVTNNPKVRSLRLRGTPVHANATQFRTLLTEKLFPAWGLSGVAEWYWIKTTSLGEPVWSLDSTHRRCYEGAFRPLCSASLLPLDSLDRDTNQETEFRTPPRLPQLPIPTSRTPALQDLPLDSHRPLAQTRPPRSVPPPSSSFSANRNSDLLRPSLSWLNGRTPNVLEMFARTTLAGPLAEGGERGVWLSVGNEAVKFNVLETGEGAKGWLEEKEE